MADIPNKTVIELSAVNKLKESLLRTERVVPDIRDNDKTPSWDGELRLYSSAIFSKENLVGKIPVQVKGKWVERFQRNPIKFDVEVSDLNNYKEDGGAIFFVVHMKDFDTYKIYYRTLLPFDLRRILSDAGEQKTKRIKLELFPQKYRDGMLRILADFNQNKKKQGTLLPNICSMEDLKNSEMEIERLEFSVPGIGVQSQDDAWNRLLESTPYIYVKPKGLDMSVVVDKIRPEQIISKNNTPIVVNGEALYNEFEVIRKAGGVKEYRIGSDITITADEQHLHFNYAFKGSLGEQIAELKLLSALMQKQDVLIGEFNVGNGNYNGNGHSLDEISERLTGLQRIQHTLEILHVKKDLNLGELTETDVLNLNQLVNGILDKRPVALSADGKAGAGKLTIGNLKIMLSLVKDKKGKGFLISDFFKSKKMVFAEKGQPPSNGVSISPYVTLDATGIREIDNIDFSGIVASIKKFPYTEMYGAKIVLFILELLKYYDSMAEKDNTVLDVIEGLTDFLEKNDHERNELYRVNFLQTQKRKRSLTTDEIQYLMSLKESGMPVEYQLAASILLESFQEAQVLYEHLDGDMQKQFDDYPICHLWDGRKSD